MGRYFGRRFLCFLPIKIINQVMGRHFFLFLFIFIKILLPIDTNTISMGRIHLQAPKFLLPFPRRNPCMGRKHLKFRKKTPHYSQNITSISFRHKKGPSPNNVQQSKFNFFYSSIVSQILSQVPSGASGSLMVLPYFSK